VAPRALAAVPLLAFLGLAACDAGHGAEAARILARSQAADPPQLWLVQSVNPAGAATSATFVCADARLRDAFGRTRAEVDGAPCRDVTPPLMQNRQWALRCQARGRLFALSARTLGDVTEDFRLEVALTPLMSPARGEPMREAHRFRHVGACPTGWRAGDQARPGQRPRRFRS